uniref:Uncharacterized protein n=1 Tax=Glossina austeni TaxID=7395 RepID=A0A1A9UJI3_GLOAU
MSWIITKTKRNNLEENQQFSIKLCISSPAIALSNYEDDADNKQNKRMSKTEICGKFININKNKNSSSSSSSRSSSNSSSSSSSGMVISSLTMLTRMLLFYVDYDSISALISVFNATHYHRHHHYHYHQHCYRRHNNLFSFYSHLLLLCSHCNHFLHLSVCFYATLSSYDDVDNALMMMKMITMTMTMTMTMAVTIKMDENIDEKKPVL